MSEQKNLVQRFFTERPKTRSDFVFVWLSICLTPIVAWPIVGWIAGSMSEGFARILPILIIAPIGSGIVLLMTYSRRKR